MPPRSRLESLPAEVLSGILTWCSRNDLVNLAQTYRSLHTVCFKEVTNHPFAVNLTSGNLKPWAVYFRQKNTFLTLGPRSLDVTIDATVRELFDAFDVFGRGVVNAEARHIHVNLNQIIPFRSNMRKLSLKLIKIPDRKLHLDILLLLLLGPLPEQCPHLEELSIQVHSMHPFDQFDNWIPRLTRLRKLRLDMWSLPNVPKLLSLIPASLTHLYLWTTDVQIQEEGVITVPWVRGIQKIVFAECAPQGIANVLKFLSRGGATRLAELSLRENWRRVELAARMPLREALTVGLQEFSLLQPPLHTLSLDGPSAWSDSLHLPLLHTAVASTLTQLSFGGVDSCIFPSLLPWPRLQSLELIHVPKMGYQGSLIEPIFPVLTALTMFGVNVIQAPKDLFPALETIKWKNSPTLGQIAGLVRHDIKRIDMVAYYEDDAYEPLWEAMGGHTIDLIELEGRFSDRMKELVKSGERIFPEFPNIREFTISRF